MLPLFVSLVAGATPSLAAPGFTCPGVDPGICDAYLEHFVSSLGSRGVRVLSKSDVAQVLSLERQRQLLGCAEGGTSCLAELAGALGVASVLTGTVAKLESGFVATLKVIDGADGTTRWTATERVDAERALFAFLEGRARDLAVFLTPPPPPPPFVRFVPGLVGSAVAASALLWQLAAWGEAAELRLVVEGSRRTPEEVIASARRGAAFQAMAFGSLVVGVAGVVASIVWLAVGSSEKPPPVALSVGAGPGGGAVGLSWEWP